MPPFTTLHIQHYTTHLNTTTCKGPTFPFTGLLDTITFQNPINLCQYLHYTFNHPKSLYKGLIQSECIRYTNMNSTEAHYQATVELLKRRLIKRQYPHKLVNKVVSTVKFTDRQILTAATSMSHFHSKPNIQMPTPTPVYSVLKVTILNHYNLIQHCAHDPDSSLSYTRR